MTDAALGQFDTGKLSEIRGVARKTITNQWGAIRKKVDDPSVQLSESEVAFLKDAGQCLTSSPQVSPRILCQRFHQVTIAVPLRPGSTTPLAASL
jgi:hypothetical protein